MRFLRQIIFILLSVLICELLGAQANEAAINVKEFGTIPLLQDADDTLTFYATVENSYDEMCTIGLKMEKCCQIVTESEVDCESMVLHSALDILILPKEQRNLTMFYTNMYLHGRTGNCSILVRWRPTNAGPAEYHKFTVAFDTTLPEKNALLFWQRNPDEYSLCSSIDEDPKNGCSPVNCLIKYSGFRSVYDIESKRCVKESRCTNPTRNKQTLEINNLKILSPISGKCLDLSLNHFPGGLTLHGYDSDSRASPYPSYPIKNKCIHGFVNDSKCICYKGWTSSPFPSETFNPDFDTYSACDIRSWEGAHDEKAKNASISLTFLFVLIVLLVVCVCLWISYYFWKYVRPGNTPSSTDKKLPGSSTSRVISEVKNRREVKMRPAKNYPTHTVVSPGQVEMALNAIKSRESILERRKSRTEQPEQPIEPKEASRQESVRSIMSTPSRKDKYVTSRKSSPTTVFHPQFSKTAMIPMPSPLTPVKVNFPIIGASTVGPLDSPTKPKAPEVQLPEINSNQDSPSVIKLKSLVKKVEKTTKEFNHEIRGIMNEVSDRGLDKFSAIKLHPVEEDSNPLIDEFWEGMSESGSESSTESIPEERKKGYWVDKLQAELVIERPPIPNSSSVAKSSISQPSISTDRWISSKVWDSKVETLRSHFQIIDNNQNKDDNQNHEQGYAWGPKVSSSTSVPNVGYNKSSMRD